MESHQHARLRRINSYLMLLAVVAFVLQGVSAVVARAAASAGVMPQPAEVMNGPVHFHGLLGHGLHTDGDNAAGHVHIPSGAHHDDADDDDPNLEPELHVCDRPHAGAASRPRPKTSALSNNRRMSAWRGLSPTDRTDLRVPPA